MRDAAERALVSRAIEGDEEAIIELLESAAPELRRRLEPRIPKRLRARVGVDDLVQQTFVDACRSIRHFEPREDQAFEAWLERIAERNLIDVVRMLEAAKRGGDRLRVEARTREDSCRGLLDLIGASGSTPSGVAAAREGVERLNEALESLPGDYQAVVEMYDLQGRSIEQVSAALGRSVGAAFMLRARAHRALAEVLGRGSESSGDRRE